MKTNTSNSNLLIELHRWVWTRIIQSSQLSEECLQTCRILLPALYLLFYMPDFSWIATLPDAWYDPALLSLAAPFQSFPSALFFQISQSLLVLCALAIMADYRARAFGIAFCLIHILINSFEYSVGKVDHVTHLFILSFFCLSLGNWGKAVANGSFKLPIPCGSLLAVLLAFGMFTAGFEKSLKWIDFDPNTSGFLSWHFSGYYNLGRTELVAPFLASLPKFLLECLDYSAVLFEMSPLICLLLGKRYWVAWCIVACSFHAGTTAMLNISFPYQLFGYLPFLLPIIPGKLSFDRNSFSQLYIIYLTMYALTTYRIAAIWTDSLPLLRPTLLPTTIAQLVFDLIVWLLLAGMGLYHLYQLSQTKQPQTKQASVNLAPTGSTLQKS